MELINSLLPTVQVISIVAGIVISVLSFNASRSKEAEARKMEAMKPFFELRQKLYLEAIHAGAVLGNPDIHSEAELSEARKRFRQLYVGELSMVEAGEVERKMVQLAGAVDPALLEFTPAQRATYNLAHSLRDSFVANWKESLGGTPR
jgi:hypothetical protein